MVSRPERATVFGAVAEDYDRLRPGPPEAAIDWLVPARARVAVDVGAGTGLLTRGLARKVERVVAVEPDERMRAVLAARSPGVEVLAGWGEAIPLPDASADGVFVSSAWHWMEPARAVPEIARVLRDGGRFGVIGTSFSVLGKDGSELSWHADLRLPRGGTGPDADTGRAGRRGFQPEEMVLPAGSPFENIAVAAFSFTRSMTVDTLIELLGTYSGVIAATPQDRAAGLARVRAALLEQFGEAAEIEVPSQARCWRADRIGPAR